MSAKSDQLIGIGLRCEHYNDVLKSNPAIGWFEVHSENYFYLYSNAAKQLLKIRQHYPVSLHGIALSLGSSEGLELEHLVRLKKLIEFIDPFVISEHLSWSKINNIYLPDLLPIAYTDESAKIFIQNIKQAQDYLNKNILIENPSSYFEYKASCIDEAEFLVYIAKSSGSKILLDVNNIFVSCSNHGWNSYTYINKIPRDLVGEIHLAGHSVRNIKHNNTNVKIRVDTHNDYVCNEVWDLYQYAIERFGPQLTLLEWDQDIPGLDILVAEADKAKKYINYFNNTACVSITDV